MSFCADILVPKETGMRIVCTGDAGATQAESLAKACYTAGVYYVKEAGYPYAVVQVFECCDACKGAGHTYKRTKRTAKQLPCKACKSVGTWPVGEQERIGGAS